MDTQELRDRIVRAADRLYYARGTSNVGMDAVRDESGASLKAIYKQFSSKEDLILAVLQYRHDLWTQGVQREAACWESPDAKILAVYDFLASWFTEETFRGCGFINAFGELGATSERVAEAVRAHKKSFQDYVTALVEQAGWPAELGAQLALLAEGAQTTAAISGDISSAETARRAAVILIEASRNASRWATA
ncbi:TetR/AcrR family transcriptional regulator [Glutamicibacter protophormiae]|uniref:TetR/AcrR family transcriptional regulator n=1 Tax=Glutamicibacter protophormiae TaxID=37930 RepID=UPI00332FBB9A